jgi:hypothetical protein
VHKKYVQPSRLTLSRVGSHYAVASLFEEFPDLLNICNYRAESEDYMRIESGTLRLAVGKTRVHSLITHSVKQFYFAVIWLGQNHIIGNSSSFIEASEYEKMKSELSEAFNNSRVADVIGIMQTYFGPEKFSLWNLFKDEQRKVLDQIIRSDIEQAEKDFKTIYSRNYNILQVMKEARLPIPKVLMNNLENVINTELRHLFKNGSLHAGRLEQVTTDALRWEVKIDKTSISYVAAEKIYHLLKVLDYGESGLRELDLMLSVFKELNRLEIEMDLVEFQNEYFQRGRKLIFEKTEGNFKASEHQQEWMRKYLELGRFIQVKLPQAQVLS